MCGQLSNTFPCACVCVWGELHVGGCVRACVCSQSLRPVVTGKQWTSLTCGIAGLMLGLGAPPGVRQLPIATGPLPNGDPNANKSARVQTQARSWDTLQQILNCGHKANRDARHLLC